VTHFGRGGVEDGGRVCVSCISGVMSSGKI
jgi:hypothetical protein